MLSAFWKKRCDRYASSGERTQWEAFKTDFLKMFFTAPSLIAHV
jgi:hypothetical protein